MTNLHCELSDLFRHGMKNDNMYLRAFINLKNGSVPKDVFDMFLNSFQSASENEVFKSGKSHNAVLPISNGSFYKCRYGKYLNKVDERVVQSLNVKCDQRKSISIKIELVERVENSIKYFHTKSTNVTFNHTWEFLYKHFLFCLTESKISTCASRASTSGEPKYKFLILIENLGNVDDPHYMSCSLQAKCIDMCGVYNTKDIREHLTLSLESK